MPTTPARTADDIADTIRSLVDRVLDAEITQQVARRGQEIAEQLMERGADAGDRANDVWRESRPVRKDAAKRLSRASHDAAKWSDRQWRKSVRPMLKDAWKQRAIAAGAAGAAVPAGRELVDGAAVRLGLRQREERHWGSFFLGLLVGAAAGAIIALLTAPKRGEEMRQELGSRADELASRARDEWVPMFQNGPTNGHAASADETLHDAAGSVQEGATEAGAASGEAADQAAADAAEAINESYETVDRETTG